MTSGLKLNARTLSAILLGLAVVVAAAGWFLAVSPKRSKVSKLDAAVQAKQTELATAQHAQAAATGVVGAKPKVVGEALPDVPGMPDVVDQLNALAARAGVSLDTVTPQPSVAGLGYQAVPISVVVDGHYFGVEQFLHLVRTQVRLDKNHLQARGRLFDVQGVQMQQTEPAPMVTATLSLRTFYYSPTAAPPTPASTSGDGTDTTATPSS
jgi:hypothetical protein